MERADYIEEAYKIMQDVEEVADLLEERDEAEMAYCKGKSALAFNIINQLYVYLNDEHKAELAEYLAKDARDNIIDKACRELCHNCTHEDNCEGHCNRYKHFYESMKGE